MNSMCRRGTAVPISSRTWSMTAKTSRERRLRGVSRTTMSPEFCAVAKNPSSAPVRRAVPVTSGVAARMLSAMPTSRLVSARAVPPGVK